MEVFEGSFDWRATPRWSVNGYTAIATCGPVVRQSFASGPALYAYIENVLQF
jgi:hypothetical protein